MTARRAKRLPVTKPDCLSCGACCVAPNDQEVFCDVEEKDLERLGSAWVRRNVLLSSSLDRFAAALGGQSRDAYGAIKTRWTMQRSGPLKGFELCSCVALKGSVMSGVKCSVYEKRPETCRTAVIPGDRTCREIRRAFTDLQDQD